MSRRRRNKKNNPKRDLSLKADLDALRKAGIKPILLSPGHYRICLNKKRVDWWPSSGLWRDVRSGRRGNGLIDLVKHVQSPPLNWSKIEP